jgi:hypothetical protein
MAIAVDSTSAISASGSDTTARSAMSSITGLE